jgi:hypothetical protein
LERKVSDAGLVVRRSSCFNSIAVVPAWLLARLQRGSGRTESQVEDDEAAGELSLPPAWINRGLYGLLGVERFWVSRLGRLPVGVGVLILAQRTR